MSLPNDICYMCGKAIKALSRPRTCEDCTREYARRRTLTKAEADREKIEGVSHGQDGKDELSPGEGGS